MITVRSSDLEKFRGDVQRLKREVSNTTDEGIRESARKTQSRIQARAPRATGRLAGSVRTTEGINETEISVEAGHAVYQEFGTRHHRAQPFVEPSLDEAELERDVEQRFDRLVGRHWR